MSGDFLTISSIPTVKSQQKWVHFPMISATHRENKTIQKKSHHRQHLQHPHQKNPSQHLPLAPLGSQLQMLKKPEKKNGTLPRHLNSHMPPCTRMSSGVFSPPHSTRHTPSNKQAWRWLRNFMTPVVTNLGSKLSRSWGVPRLPNALVGGFWPPKTIPKTPNLRRYLED